MLLTYFTAFHMKDWPFIFSSFQFSLKSMTQSSNPLNLQTLCVSWNPHTETDGFCVKTINKIKQSYTFGSHVGDWCQKGFISTNRRETRWTVVWSSEVHLELNTISDDCIFIDKVNFKLVKQTCGEGTSSAMNALWLYVVIWNVWNFIVILYHFATFGPPPTTPQISSQSCTQHNILIPAEYRKGPQQ